MHNLRRGRRRPRIQALDHGDDSGSSDNGSDSYDEDDDDGHCEDMEQGEPPTAGEDHSNMISSNSNLDSIQNTNTAIGVLGVSYSRLRRIDQSWEEKIWMCVDALQLFALLWSLSQPWPWPRPWLAGSRWVVYVNLDVVSIVDAAMTITGPGTTSSPWGERPGYMWYGSLFSLVPVVIVSVWSSRVIIMTIWLNRVMLFHRYVLGRGKPPALSSTVLSGIVAFERVVLRCV